MAEVSEFLRKKAAASSGVTEPSEFLKKKAAESGQRKKNEQTSKKPSVTVITGAQPSAHVPTEMLKDNERLSYAEMATLAQKAYDDYIVSDEYKDKQKTLTQNYLNNHRWDSLINGITGGSTVPSASGVRELTDTKAEELKATAEYFKNMAAQEENQKTMDAGVVELESWSEEDVRNLQQFINERNATQVNNMFGGQQFDSYVLNPIVQKYGIGKVRQMAEILERMQNEEAAKRVQETSRDAVTGGFWNGAGHSAATIGANLIGSMMAAPGRILELQNRTGQFSTLQEHTPYDLPALYASTVRGQIAENIAGDQYDENGNLISDGGAVRQTASYAYQGLMSSADSLARAALGGGNKVFSLGLAATGSFGQTVSDASARGAAPAQAVLLGVIDGGLEVATEYLPLDEILKVAKGGPVSGKQLLKNIFKQAAIEVTEEEVSFLGSLLAEAVVLQEKSGYKQTIAEALANGASYEDARDKANREIMLEAAETAITSTFSGGISAGVSSGAANVNNRIAQKVQEQQKPRNTDAHVELADPTVDFERETWDMCNRLAKATGRNIKLYQNLGTEAGIENGYFEDGVIYVNTESGDPVAQIVSHELTHSVEFAQEYKELSQLVLGRIEAMGGDLKQLRQEKADLYARNGKPLGSQQEIDQEIVAEYVAQNLLTNEQQIMEAVRQNRTLIEKIKGWIDKLLAAIGNKDAAERAYLTNVQNLYAKALQQTQNGPQQTSAQAAPVAVQTPVGGIQEQGAVQEISDGKEDDEAPNWDDPVQARAWAQNMLSSGQITNEEFNGYIDLAEQMAEEKSGQETYTEKAEKRKHSFAGPSAKTANSQTLAEAKELDEAGVANETIRQQTGWFKGMDGKWRWEIDDSKMQYSRAGDALVSEMHPEYARHQELMQSWLYGELSAEDEAEFRELDEVWGREHQRLNDRVRRGNATLQNVLKHDALFEAYPELRGTKIVFAETESNTKGRYDPNRNTITISEKLRNAPESTLIHEIQHAIQTYEGFASGASVEYWKEQRAEIVETIGAARKNLDLWLDDIGYKEKLYESLMQVKNKEKTIQQHWEDMKEFKASSKYARQIAACEKEIAEFQRQYDEITGGMTAYEQYEHTAGEIEARDAANRWKMDAEERKKTSPDLDDENTVFVKGRTTSEEYIPGDVSEHEIQSNIEAIADMDSVISIKADEFKMGDGRLLQDVTDFFDSVGGSVYNDRLGDVYLRKRGVKHDLGHGMSDEKATSFAAIPDVLRHGKVAGFVKNKGGKGFDSATVVAPIEIGEAPYMMGVIVHRSNNENRFYVHDVFCIKEEAAPLITGTQNVGETGGATSTISIIRKILNVKKKNAEKSTKNRQFSISAQSVDRKNVANDLRGILSRGGDVAELRRYISQLEQGGGKAERTGRNAYQSGTSVEQSESQRIIDMAKRYGISVEEYLRRNWEQYEVDGQWNEAARKALDMERRGRRYSVSETEEQTEQKTAEQIRQEMPAKAKNYLQGAQRKLLTLLYDKLGVNRFTNREDLQGIITEVADTYLTTGRVEDGKMGELFDRAYAGGIVKDAEFYEQYKEIKTHLQKTAVTISEGDSHDIADFQDFRRRNWGALRIVKQGGLPVDSAYHELNEMAPELFPESITHPADQLMRMADVSRSIQVSEKNLDAYHGPDRESFRSWARNDFENAVAEVLGDFQQVKRYMEGQEDTEEAAPTTPEEAAQYYKQLKDARRTYERAQAKNLLTPHDEMQVGKLLRGEITLEDLDPEKDFVKGITAVYEGKKEYERLCKLLAEYKRTVRGAYREKADTYLETANEWKDKKVGIAYSRETMERNIDDIVPDRDIAAAIKREYFEAVHVSEAEATRFKTEFRNRVRGLKLSTRIQKGNLVSEAHAVQLLGEAEDNIRVLQQAKGRMKVRDGKTLEEWRSVIREMWDQSPELDQAKIRRAVDEFRKIYDELFEKMNAVRIRNGYEPVNYRQGYFPHFQPGQGDGILGAFGKALNIDTQVAALPTTINGLTHTFKPGIQWFGNAQERLGFNTAYDAVEGFDKYIEGVASVIYQTENIQKLRALATQIRYRTSEDGIRRQVDAIRARDNLSEEEKQVQINSIYEHGKYTLSNFVNELDEYTNLLANKKSKFDRTVEAKLNRKIYAFVKAWEARMGANMIAGNLSSALTNFIPLTQAGAQLDKFSLIKGMAATLKAYKEDDGIVGMSTFLTNRRGSDPLVQTWVQRASKVMGTPMELIDGFTSDSIVRAAYFQNLKRGMSEAEAMHQADVFASHVMADRSKGAMPTLFASKNPLTKLITQFQLEVNNQFSEVFKDLPRRHRERGLAALTLVLLKYFLGAFLFNEIYEYFVGRRAALDPIGILNDTVGDLTGYELPNLVEWGTNAIRGEETSFQTEKVGLGEAGKNLTSNVLSELPFSSGLTLLGIEMDGGRIPASSAVPDLTAIWDAATTEGWSAEKRWKEIQDELNKLSYVIPPFGGNQIGKLWKGIKAYARGGSYSVDAEGNDILQYPVYKDAPADAIGNAARMGIFGKSALPEAQDWVERGFKSLSAKQTAAYQDMLKVGENDRKAYALLQKLQTVEKTEDAGKKLNQLEILEDADVSKESKAIVYYGLMASESEQELMDSLADAGAEQSEIGQLMMDLYHADQFKGTAKRIAQQKALKGVSMTDEEKKMVVGNLLGTNLTTDKGEPTQYASFLSAIGRGLSVDDFMDMRSKGIDVEDYLEATDAGVRYTTALELVYDMYDLDEKEDAEDVEYWRACIKRSDNEYTQLSMLGTYMNEDTFKKVTIAYNLDVSPEMFVTYHEKRSEHDADGNGSYTQAEVKAVIDAIGKGYTIEQKGVLWQMATGSKSTKNNPYSKEAGQRWLDEKAKAKAKE